MSRPWRNFSIVLFLLTLASGTHFGGKVLAISGETQDDLKLYTEILHAAHENYGDEVTYRDLVYSSIQGMLRTLDPHTSFLTPRSYDDMRQRQQRSFFGLGILVSMRNGQLTVISPIEGTPAWRLGMRAGDIISTIEGEPTDTMSLDEAISRLKGPKDTTVNIAIVRRGLDEPLEMAVTRAEIPQTTVRFAYMLRPDIGYIRLTDFSRSTSQEMRDAVEKLSAAGMRQLVLDLRSNGGGLLDQTVDVSGLFVPQESRIVETRGRTRDSDQEFFSSAEQAPIEIPVVVLVNSGTASAAEILAGAIQDHDVGLVVGTPTWGKGLVQTVYNLSYGAGIALTTAKYYTPAGRLIQRDYSSYFDYYTHFNDADAADGDTPAVALEGREFRTDLGRPVYGGGGITPDIIVELPETPDGLAVLFTRNAFFDFAVDYHSQQPVSGLEWQPPEALLTEFRDWLVAEEIGTSDMREQLFSNPEATEIMERQIHADLLNSAFGPEPSHKVLAEGDPQIQAALGLLDQAADLLASRLDLDGGGELPRFNPRATSVERAEGSGADEGSRRP